MVPWVAFLLAPLAAAPPVALSANAPPSGGAEPALSDDEIVEQEAELANITNPPAALPRDSTGLYTPAHIAFWTRFVSRMDIWEGPHVTVGLGLGALFDLNDERSVRLGFHTNFLGGTWADNADRGHFIIEHGPELRFSPYMDEVVDVFLVLRGLGVLGLVDDVHWGLRPALGVGVRAGRYVSLGLNLEPVWTLGAPLVHEGEPVSEGIPAPGVGLEIGVDLCAFSEICDKTTPKPIAHDETGELYAEARSLSCALTNEELDRFCKNVVPEALDAGRYHPSDGGGGDGIGPFLDGLIDQAEPSQQPQLQAIVERHDRLRRLDRADEAYGLFFARDGRKLAHPIIYEPVVLELRRQLGCDPDDPPMCPGFSPGRERWDERAKERDKKRADEIRVEQGRLGELEQGR